MPQFLELSLRGAWIEYAVSYEVQYIHSANFFWGGVDRVPEWFKNCKTLKGTNDITDKRARGLLGKC